MESKPNLGRHRKPRSAGALATRLALSTGAAAAAVLMAGGTATTATASAEAPAAEMAPGPCTNTPLDAIIGPLAQTNCNDPAPSAPDDVTGDDPTQQGAPDSPPEGSGGNPPGA